MSIEPVYWNAKFHDLPWIVSKPSPMSDDDNEFHSDLLYMRALLNDISDAAHATRKANPIPIDFADNMAWVQQQLANLSQEFTSKSVLSQMLKDWQK